MSETYSIEPVPARPRLPGTVIVRKTADETIDAAAADLLLQAHNCVRAFGDFHLALSGGKTPMPLYERLMIDPRYRELPWQRTHIWIVDERRVTFEDERSNFRHIADIFLHHSGIPRSHLHPINALRDDADADYEKTLRETLAWREKGHDRLDYVLLGMGDDGHTASLFPHSPVVEKEVAGELGDASAPGALVRINAGPRVTPPDRVTMTLRLINASRFVGILVTGKSKRRAVERVMSAAGKDGDGARSVAELPVLGVKPIGGELRWYLDYDACPGVAEPASESRSSKD